jgi:hypothetical protein
MVGRGTEPKYSQACIGSRSRVRGRLAVLGHKALSGHVRFGSKADITRRLIHVRFTPKSGHC